MTRGLVVSLTDQQIVKRALYLAGFASLHDLDEHVRRDPAELERYGIGENGLCPTLYYLLRDHNGGKDPCAPDPATRWVTAGGSTARTVDCSGGNAWMHGFSRWQPLRFGHIYQGWINTDSKILDADGPALCFIDMGRPFPGAIITCKSGSPGHAIGHEGCVVAVHCAEWDPAIRELWDQIDVVDCAARRVGGQPSRSNKLTTARGWFGTDARFLRSIMQP